MTGRRKLEASGRRMKRLHLHPCHLQAMHGDGFVRIANKVLRGELTLLNYGDRFSTKTAAGAAAR
jgi:hypothetical protein